MAKTVPFPQHTNSACSTVTNNPKFNKATSQRHAVNLIKPRIAKEVVKARTTTNEYILQGSNA